MLLAQFEVGRVGPMMMVVMMVMVLFDAHLQQIRLLRTGLTVENALTLRYFSAFGNAFVCRLIT